MKILCGTLNLYNEKDFFLCFNSYLNVKWVFCVCWWAVGLA